MGKKERKSFFRQKKYDEKRVNPIALLLTALVGAAVALVAVLCLRGAKRKKASGVRRAYRNNSGGGAADRDRAQRDRAPGELLIENPRQIKPYRPRKRVSAKKVFGRAAAMTAAAALVVTGLYTAPSDSLPVPTVQARESFGGMKQVVEEHDEKDPFVILDIVPGVAHADVKINGQNRGYDISLGTIGYLAPGQSPVQKELARIFKGDEKENTNEDFYKYADRKALTNLVIGSGEIGNVGGGITYEEAYGGTQTVKGTVWTQIYKPVAEVKHDGDGKLTDEVPYPTGRLYARVEKRAEGSSGSGFDYNLTWQPEGSSVFDASVMTVPTEGIYTFAEGQGDYHVIFGEPVMAANGYRAEVIKSVSGGVDEVKSAFAEYVDATGLYYVKDGRYEYMCTLGEFKGIPTPEPKPVKPVEPEKPETPTEPEKPETPTEPEKPETPTEPEKPETPTEPEKPETPTEPEKPETPTEPEKPETPTEPENPETPEEPAEPEKPETPTEPEKPTEPVNPEQTSARESARFRTEASAFWAQSARKKAGTADGWYLCAGIDLENPQNPADSTDPKDPADPTNPKEPTDPTDPKEPTDPTDPKNPTNPTDPIDPADPKNPIDPVNPTDPEDPADPVNPKEPTPEPAPALPEGTYCILKFAYTETEQEELLYQIKDVNAVSADEEVPRPYDSYILEKGLLQNKLNAAETGEDVLAAEPALAGKFEYVGGNKGTYRITKSAVKNAAGMAGTVSQDAETQDGGLEEIDAESGGQDAGLQAVSTGTAEIGAGYYIEVQNAPVYIKCAGGNDFLRRYVFHSLKSQDNEFEDFAVTVNTKLAGEVTQEDVETADLVYLEDGTGPYLNPDAKKRYILPKSGEDTAEGLKDVEKIVVSSLVKAAAREWKPVIVDYGIIEEQANGVSENYKGSDYQKLAKAFLKKDLLAFCVDMEKEGNLADNILMNAESTDYPNKEETVQHYVNRNVYIVSGTPLVGEDFPTELEKREAKAGFGEVLAAIKAENLLLPKDDKIPEKVSKAVAVQYIINYSLGLVGEYKDLTILELQPTANKESDLHFELSDDKKNAVLYWKRKDHKGAGQQIFRSARKIETAIKTSSVAAFNSSYQDINEAYNMIFIGLDGQRLNRDWREDGEELETRYNDEEALNGKVYHRGDSVNDSERYDASDITERKMEELLNYLQAGYPIVVEDACFKNKSAKKAIEEDINKDYIDKDTWMFQFLSRAIADRLDEDDDDGESGVGIYTIEDVHSSAEFVMQLNAQRPKLALLEENDNTGENDNKKDETDDGEEQIASDMIETKAVPEKPGVLRGSIRYRISSDRTGEDKTYSGSLEKHLYLDLNYDGVFATEEECTGYQLEEADGVGTISVDFNEINFGIVPWKLEVRDSAIEFRRASIQGCFTLKGSENVKLRVLQVIDDKGNEFADLKEICENIDNSMLGYYMEKAETRLGITWDIETFTPAELQDVLDDNENYLARSDVVVLGFGNSGNPGEAVMKAVNDYIDAGGSVLVSSAGASEAKDRLGISLKALGQEEKQKTYGKLSLQIHDDFRFRYDGIEAGMLEKKPGLGLDRINDGTISRWPYPIREGAQLGSRTEVAMPDYLLHIGNVRKNNEDRGKAYTTAWFTLIDPVNKEGAYSVSPGDGCNNYYAYSNGNVVYVGQTEYKYTYNEVEGELAYGDGMDECMIFVNALMAAYNAGVHRGNVMIVAGFTSKSGVESVTVPFDVTFEESGTDGDKGGILGETVDVYFRFTDNNIAVDKVTTPTFYFKEPGAPADAELLLSEGGINPAFHEFPSAVWTVENNRLAEVDVTNGILPGKVYRIKAPLTALQLGKNLTTSQICVLLTSEYTRAEEKVRTLSTDNVSLNRAQMFMLE